MLDLINIEIDNLHRYVVLTKRGRCFLNFTRVTGHEIDVFCHGVYYSISYFSVAVALVLP